MSGVKTILILGGTGFVGRSVVEKYLKNNWRVVITTRIKSINEAKSKLLLHGFNKKFLEKYVSDNSLLFAFNVDLTEEKWFQRDNWTKLLNGLNIAPPSISRIINLVGETSKSVDEILRSNIKTLESIFTSVKYIKSQNRSMLFVNMGSVAEKKYGKTLSPYENAKKIARQEIEESNLCHFHFIAHYIKGKGEQKMKSAAPVLWNKLKFSRKWLSGFKVGVIDVDDLAEVIYHLLEVIRITPPEHRPIEVNVTNGELVFGEMVKNLLPENKRDIPKLIIPNWLEKIFLRLYSIVIPLIKPNNQFAQRLASFAKRSLIDSKKQNRSEIFRTAEDIKKLALDVDNYKALERSPNLIIANKHYPVIYVLRERNKEELEQIVQKALVP